MKVRELVCEVSINEMEWYTVILERDTGVEGMLAYHLNVYYEDDDTPSSDKLVAGTKLYDAGNGLESLIESRTVAVRTFNIVVSELLAYIHFKREPKHPLLTMMNDSARIEEIRKELEDMFDIVIE